MLYYIGIPILYRLCSASFREEYIFYIHLPTPAGFAILSYLQHKVSHLSLSLSLSLSVCASPHIVYDEWSVHTAPAVVGRYAMSTANVRGVRISTIYYNIFPLNLTFSYDVISITDTIVIIIFIVRV